MVDNFKIYRGLKITAGDVTLDAANKLIIGTTEYTSSGAPAHAASHNAGGGDVMAIDSAAGTGSLRTLGTAATAACAGNDSRLSDSRTPTAHASTHINTGSDRVAGILIRAPQFLTSGTSYTPPTNCTAIYVEALGGGGGGAGAPTAASSAAAGSGGRGGAYCAKYFSGLDGSALTYAIGAGGSGGVGAANGSAGGDTTFTVGATTITAAGGNGGLYMNAGTANATQIDPGVTASTNGDINGSAQTAFYAIRFSGTIAMSGSGGNTIWGSGGRGVNQAANGVAGAGRGGGGGGALVLNGSAEATGGDGAAGAIRIWEFV